MATKNNSDYRPTPVYDRKMLRGMIRTRTIQLKGYHNVSALMSESFKIIRNRMIEEEREIDG